MCWVVLFCGGGGGGKEVSLWSMFSSGEYGRLFCYLEYPKASMVNLVLFISSSMFSLWQGCCAVSWDMK